MKNMVKLEDISSWLDIPPVACDILSFEGLDNPFYCWETPFQSEILVYPHQMWNDWSIASDIIHCSVAHARNQLVALEEEGRLNPAYLYYIAVSKSTGKTYLIFIKGAKSGEILPHPMCLTVAEGLGFETTTQHSFRTFQEACDCVNESEALYFSLILRYDDDNGTRFLNLNKENIKELDNES